MRPSRTKAARRVGTWDTSRQQTEQEARTRRIAITRLCTQSSSTTGRSPSRSFKERPASAEEGFVQFVCLVVYCSTIVLCVNMTQQPTATEPATGAAVGAMAKLKSAIRMLKRTPGPGDAKTELLATIASRLIMNGGKAISGESSPRTCVSRVLP